MLVEGQPPTTRSSGSGHQRTCLGKAVGVSVTRAPVAHEAATMFRIRSPLQVEGGVQHHAAGCGPCVGSVMACKQCYRADRSGMCATRCATRRSLRRRSPEPGASGSSRLATSYGFPGHRNVIRASAPYVYRASARRGLRLACARAFWRDRDLGWRVRHRQSTASQATQPVSRVAPCVTSQLPKGHGIEQERRSSRFVTNCSEYD
jgi:hypothetical protein